eukprot:2148663-Prorocentrum_lima.AAC.1
MWEARRVGWAGQEVVASRLATPGAAPRISFVRGRESSCRRLCSLYYTHNMRLLPLHPPVPVPSSISPSASSWVGVV